ncbi:MAG: CPBP family intramembrane metalloprotease [Chloroflexi bacterium]|nr:CPBP family intramembrane metalloprotease [Chloroflexota bacterium]
MSTPDLEPSPPAPETPEGATSPPNRSSASFGAPLSPARLFFAGVGFLVLSALPVLTPHRHHAEQPGLLHMGLMDWSLVVLLWLALKMESSRTGRPSRAGSLLPVNSRAILDFVVGCASGLALLSLVVFTLSAAGCYHLSAPSSGPVESLKWGAAMAVVFLGVGAAEEFLFRGIVLQRIVPPLSPGAAAVVSSLVFAGVHISNPGENLIGIVQVFVAGLLFAVIVLRTGNLWMAIGLHAAWDWSQNFLYSTPDSGIVLPHGLLHTSISGPVWLSGGSVGPEGSVVATVVLLLATAVFWRFLSSPGAKSRAVS